MPAPRKGRGALANPVGRFEATRGEPEDDGWWSEPVADRLPTEVRTESARSVIARNDSPDLPFDYSINPYRGCEHGCVYCYARPTHEYLGLSAGLDFETRLTAKANAAEALRRELSRRGYRPSPINLGAATDPYQPIERDHRITRALLEVFLETRHPLTIVTKNALVLRDLDLLRALAERRLVEVNLSVTTLDNRLAALMEPRASAPHARLRAVAELAAAGVPVGVFVAPVIPALTDAELETVMAAAAEAGAQWLSYTLVRLPHGVAALFRDWLAAHVPDRAAHVMSLLQQIRGGRANDPRFGTRMRGEGAFAELIRQRFERRRRALGLDGERLSQLDLNAFRSPVEPSRQGDFFA